MTDIYGKNKNSPGKKINYETRDEYGTKKILIVLAAYPSRWSLEMLPKFHLSPLHHPQKIIKGEDEHKNVR